MAATRLALLTLLVGLAAGFGVGLTLRQGPVKTARAAERSLTPGGDSRAVRPDDSDRSPSLVPGRASQSSPPQDGARPTLESRVESEAESAAARVAVDEPAPELSEEEVGWTESLVGIVEDDRGQPLEGVTVVTSNFPNTRRYEARSSEGVGRAWNGMPDVEEELVGEARDRLLRRSRTRVATTDAAGRFELDRLRPGSHRLQAYAEGWVFESRSFEVGHEAFLAGQPVSELELDVRLPDGTAPTEAVVRVERNSLRWTPEEPVLRLEEPRAQIEVLAGDVRGIDRDTWLAAFGSERTTIDVEREGSGPHRIELTARAALVVTVIDDSPAGVRPWVKVLREDSVGTQELAEALERASRLERDSVSDDFVTTDVKPGRYIVCAGRSSGPHEVQEVVEIAETVERLELVLGELDLSRFLVARVTDPEGRALRGVDFRYERRSENGRTSGGAGEIERPDRSYWLPLARLLGDDGWQADTELSITAIADGHGQTTEEVAMGATEVRFVFSPACDLTVRVTGVLDGEFNVGVRMIKDEPEQQNVYFGGSRSNSERVDGEGIARFSDLQPGRARVTLNRSSQGRFRGWSPSVAFVDVDLRAGPQEVTMAVPTFHDVVVHAPDVEGGAGFMLRPADDSNGYSQRHAELESDQRARFEGVPAGEYVLSSWSGNMGVMRVTIPSGEILFEPQTIEAYRVTRVVEGKAAEKADVQVGDILVALDGKSPVGNVAIQRLYLDVLERGVPATFERGGAPFEVTFGPFEGTTNAWSELGFQTEPYAP